MQCFSELVLHKKALQSYHIILWNRAHTHLTQTPQSNLDLELIFNCTNWCASLKFEHVIQSPIIFLCAINPFQMEWGMWKVLSFVSPHPNPHLILPAHVGEIFTHSLSHGVVFMSPTHTNLCFPKYLYD